MTDLHYIPLGEFERVRRLSCDPASRTRLFATLCRINTLYMIARAGSGHIGSSFSSLDIVAWLFLNELGLADGQGAETSRGVYFSSKGHDVPGLYAVLIGLGLIEFDKVHALRRLGGLPGHPDVFTPFITTNTGSLGMGVSKAKGMALANRLHAKRARIFVLTGDGELQEGQFWESLQPAANLGLSEITVIVDHNKLQSDTWVSRTSDLGDLEKKVKAFGWHVARCDGHDLATFGSALSGATSVTDRPQLVIADTVKGKGVSFMEHTAIAPGETLYRFHSGAPDDESYLMGVTELITHANAQLRQLGLPKVEVRTARRPPRPSADGSQRLVGAYSKALVEQAEQNSRIVALDADLVLDTGLIPFQGRFPERFVECGIAEQDMVSQASGMALKGLLPVVHSFACFLSTRPNEQIYNSATERRKVVYVGSLAGLLPGGPGHSHQSVRDISALAAIPGLILVEPCNEAEVSQVVDFCLNRTPESCYIRLVSIPCQIPYELPAEYRLEPGRGVALTDGQDAVLFGYGPVSLSEAYLAARTLSQKHGLRLKVVNLPWLNRLDTQWLEDVVKGYSWVFTVDNHYMTGGPGEMIASHVAELGLSHSVRVKRFGVTDIPACGQNDEVLRAHRLDAESLVRDIVSCMSMARA